MLSLKKLVLGDKARIAVSLILYAVFFAVIVEKIATADNYSPVIIYSIFLIFLVFAVLNEFLRFNYILAVELLQKRCNPDKALEKVDLVKKYDLFKGYRPQLAVLEAMIYTDKNEPNKVIDLIEDKESRLFSTNSMRVQGYYYLFKSYVLLNNKKHVKRCFKSLNEYKESLGKSGKKAVGRSIWDVINGDYYLTMGRPDEALEAYNNANTAEMTKRDLAHYYLSKAKLAESQNNPEEKEKNCIKALELAPDMGCVIDYAKAAGLMH
ncbi:MAG TPA: hypothetical protein GX505_10830 [Clostridiales bacterium]|nr:hypothetical protein [Clostridiales bacterium]